MRDKNGFSYVILQFWNFSYNFKIVRKLPRGSWFPPVTLKQSVTKKEIYLVNSLSCYRDRLSLLDLLTLKYISKILLD